MLTLILTIKTNIKKNKPINHFFLTIRVIILFYFIDKKCQLRQINKGDRVYKLSKSIMSNYNYRIIICITVL